MNERKALLFLFFTINPLSILILVTEQSCKKKPNIVAIRFECFSGVIMKLFSLGFDFDFKTAIKTAFSCNSSSHAGMEMAEPRYLVPH